jgi:hypothetical protein
MAASSQYATYQQHQNVVRWLWDLTDSRADTCSGAGTSMTDNTAMSLGTFVNTLRAFPNGRSNHQKSEQVCCITVFFDIDCYTCENYFLPDSGFGRVMVERPVRWDYFYDQVVRNILWLVRHLIKLRGGGRQFRTGQLFFYNDWSRYQSQGILLFSRYDADTFSLVALNFSDDERSVPFWFPGSGNYREELHGQHDLMDVVALQERSLTVPSNYGRIWTKHS